MRWLIGASLIVAACRPAAPPSAPPGPVVDEAQAFERGQGQPRDYARAAAIHATRCDRGRGDRAACDALLEAMRTRRGLEHDPEGLLTIGDRLCARGDDAWCANALMERNTQGARLRVETGAELSSADAERTLDEAKRYGDLYARAEVACKAGDGRACWQVVVSSTDDRDQRDIDDRRARLTIACADGIVAACAQHVATLGAAADPATVARVRTWCDDGDAVACAALPGRAIPDAELCKANDFAACDRVTARP